MAYKFTKIFLILGLLSALVIFFSSSSLLSYGLSILALMLITGSIGLIVDKIIVKEYKLPLILIMFLVLIGGFYLFTNINTSKAQCEGCIEEIYENIFTGDCKRFCVGCGSNVAWYWDISENCVELVLRDECDKLSPKSLEHFNNSCDIYIETTKQFYLH